MNKDIENYISEYESQKEKIATYEYQVQAINQEKEQKIEALEKQINDLNREYEKIMQPINDKIDSEKQILNEMLLNNVVQINLTDIISALASITKENTQDIKISGFHTAFSYPTLDGVTSKQELINKIIQTVKNNINISLNIHGIYNSKPYYINISYETNLSDLWADEKTLIEHSQIIAKKIINYSNGQKRISYTVPLLENGIEYAICSFNLKQIIDFNKKNDLLSKAVMKCLNMSNVKVKQKNR